jgi:hypothetical protein
MTMLTLDTEQIKARTDLRELAGRYTTLCRASAQELAGPCPKCGGDDRFHCTADWFFCRQCHDTRGDAIEFVQWIQGVDFRQACALLGPRGLPGIPPTATVVQKPKKRSQQANPGWQHRAQTLVDTAHEALWRSEAGQHYLAGRGLEPHVWMTFKLGYREAVSLPGTEGKQKAPAIVIPWVVAGTVRAVRYRFLQWCEYTDAAGRSRQEKQTAETGSAFAGVLYGGQALMRCAENERTLVLCEGEINALSIWQVAHHTALDVLSLGSKSQRLTPAMVEYAKRYQRVICWLDEAEGAKKQMVEISGAYGVQSPDGQDANDLLQAGLLGGFLSTVRILACQSDQEREKLLWDLQDAANTLQGVDAGTAQAIEWLAGELGRSVDDPSYDGYSVATLVT